MSGASSHQRMYTPPSDMDLVARATTYPYLIPDASYLFEDGGWRVAEIDEAMTAGRIPVIACGSNRSPEQLARKFADFAEKNIPVTIPVQRAWLEDFDVVYAAHITGYGSVAANLQHVPGTRVEVSITWLADDMMERMHATEGLGHNYHYARFHGLALHLEGGGVRPEAFAYVYDKGSLRQDETADHQLGGEHAALAEIRAENRQDHHMTQPEALALVQARVGHKGDLKDFISQVVADRDLRDRHEQLLQADAVPFRWRHLEILS
jgi:hypothetical protein